MGLFPIRELMVEPVWLTLDSAPVPGDLRNDAPGDQRNDAKMIRLVKTTLRWPRGWQIRRKLRGHGQTASAAGDRGCGGRWGKD